MKSVGMLKAFMWFVCAFHVVVGLALNVDLGLREWVASGLYGATVNWSDVQFVYILKPLGAFMIALGVMAAVAARDPLANRGIINGFVLLFTLRGLQRVVFMGDIQSAFAISPSRSMSTMVVMLALAGWLLILARSASAPTGVRPEPART